MSYSRTKIANLTFALLESPPTSNIDTDEGQPAVEVRSVWDMALDEALAAHPWNFAIGRWNKRAPVSADKNPAPDEWGYAFEKPADCVKVLHVNRRAPGDGGDPFEVEGDLILCDAAMANIRGIKREKQPGKYSIWFVNYFRAVLAKHVSKPLNASETIRKAIDDEMEKSLHKARSADGQEGTPPIIFRDTWLAARDGIEGEDA